MPECGQLARCLKIRKIIVFFSRKRRALVVGSGKGSGANGIIGRPSSSTGELCGGTLGSRACCRTAGGGGSIKEFPGFEFFIRKQ